VVLPPRPDLDALDLIAFEDPAVTEAIGDAIEIEPPRLSERDISYLLAFMEALTDFSAEDGRKTVPTRVPSGLPLAEIK
jgi:cytochrome c peroxidase